MGIHIYPLLRAEQCDEVYLQQTKVSTSVFAFSNPSAPHGPAHGRVHLSCAVYTFPAPKQVHLATPSHVWRRWGRGGLRGGAGWADGCADGPAASGVRPRGAGVSSRLFLAAFTCGPAFRKTLRGASSSCSDCRGWACRLLPAAAGGNPDTHSWVPVLYSSRTAFGNNTPTRHSVYPWAAAAPSPCPYPSPSPSPSPFLIITW